MVAAGLNELMDPQSVAVVGASRDPHSVGYGVLKSLVEGCVRDSGFCRKFPGKVYAINPKAREVLGLKALPSITAVKGSVDVAVVAVPSKLVPQVARECGEKGVKALVVLSAGFSETGPEGAELERELLVACRQHGMRLLGPNCLGILRPAKSYNASFALSSPAAGEIAFVTQSGALADSIIDWAIKERYAFSSMVSLGNSSDLDAADFVAWLGRDPQTKVITLYLEGLKDGRKFMDACAYISKEKPVIVLKGGRTEGGRKAAVSHTAALASDDRVFRGAMRQCGVLVAESLEDMFDLAKTLAEQPRCKENAVAVVTNGGGAGVLCSDYCDEFGVNLVPLKEETIAKLDKTGLMHPAYSRRNPLDIIGDALPERYDAAVNTLLSEDYIAGLVVVQTLQTMTDPAADAKVLVEARRKFPGKPIVCVFMGGKYSRDGSKVLQRNRVPDFNDPRKAVRAMAALTGSLKF